MDFTGYKGKIGVVIVTLAIVGSIFAGFLTSTEKTTYEGVDYDFVTDVSGLFTYDKTPQFIEYNTPKNYTGYNEYEYSSYNTTITSYVNQISNTDYLYNTTGTVSTGGSVISDSFVSYYNNPVVGSKSNYYQVLNEPVTQLAMTELHTKDVSIIDNLYTIKFDNTTLKTSGANWVILGQSSTVSDVGDSTSTIKKLDGGSQGFYFTPETEFYGYFLEYTSGSVSNILTFDNRTLVSLRTGEVTDILDYAENVKDNVYNLDTDINGWVLGGLYTNEEEVSTYEYSNLSDPVIDGNAGINYSTTTQVNNYPVRYSQEKAVTITEDLSSIKSHMTNVATNGEWHGTAYNVNTFTYYKVDNKIRTYSNFLNINGKMYCFSLADYLTYKNFNSAYDTIYLTIKSSVDSNGLIDNGLVMLTSNDLKTETTPYPDQIIFKMDASKYYNFDERNAEKTTQTAIVDRTTNIVTLYDSNGNLNGRMPIADLYFAFYNNYYLYNTWTVDVKLEDTSIEYMDINKGVFIDLPDIQHITVWSNTPYQNESVNVLFHAPTVSGVYENTFTLSTGDTITVSHTSDNNMHVTVNDDDPVTIGTWDTIILSMNAQSGSITATPVYKFVNYQKYLVSKFTTEVGTIDGDKTIDQINYELTESSLGITVVKTTVFMDTYNAVMKDATLNIKDYFPEIENLRLNFFSFALYGTSVTINGNTYTGIDGKPIRDTGKIVIGNDVMDLQDINLTFENNHIVLTFANKNKSIDLGVATDNSITFTGNWYFTTGLYEGHSVTKTDYNYQSGKFSFNAQTFAVSMVAIGILGLIVVSRFTNVELTLIDYLLVGGMAVVGFVLMGGLML